MEDSPRFEVLNDFHKACWCGDLETVKNLLSSGQDINEICYGPYRCYTGLHCAACKGHIKIVKFLIATGVNLDILNPAGFTPLNTAIWYQKPKIAKLLIENGCNVNLCDNAGNNYTPLMSAILKENVELVKMLLKNGADVNATAKATNNFNALYAAAEKSIELLKIVIAYGADLNQFGERALEIAGERFDTRGADFLRKVLKKNKMKFVDSPCYEKPVVGEFNTVVKRQKLA